jgi:hypothetical protein
MKPRNLLVSAAALVLAAVASTPSVAAVYNYSFTYNFAASTCSTAEGIRYCAEFYAVTPPSDAPGDQYDFSVNLSSRVTVPGSATLSVFYVGLYDLDSVDGATTPNTLSTFASTVFGYVGPAGLLTSGVYNNFGYYGYAGFFGPNPGFSLTGLDSTVTVDTQDASPLLGAVVTYAYAVGVPEPATWAMTLFGAGLVGAGMRLARRKDGMARPRPERSSNGASFALEPDPFARNRCKR